MTRPAARLVARVAYVCGSPRRDAGIAAALAAGMKTIDETLLHTITGGASAKPKLEMSGGCPADTAHNDALAKKWNAKNGVTRDKGGNFGAADGKNYNLYRYEYFTGSRCAPGADD